MARSPCLFTLSQDAQAHRAPGPGQFDHAGTAIRQRRARQLHERRPAGAAAPVGRLEVRFQPAIIEMQRPGGLIQPLLSGQCHRVCPQGFRNRGSSMGARPAPAIETPVNVGQVERAPGRLAIIGPPPVRIVRGPTVPERLSSIHAGLPEGHVALTMHSRGVTVGYYDAFRLLKLVSRETVESFLTARAVAFPGRFGTRLAGPRVPPLGGRSPRKWPVLVLIRHRRQRPCTAIPTALNP